jgi:hypothetical protein
MMQHDHIGHHINFIHVLTMTFTFPIVEVKNSQKEGSSKNMWRIHSANLQQIIVHKKLNAENINLAPPTTSHEKEANNK